MEAYEAQIIKAMAHEMRIEMAEKGWKQQELADKIGISRETTSRYLSGKKQMPIDIYLRAATAFGVSPADLMYRAVERAAQAGSQD